jgi:hypothetical protein
VKGHESVRRSLSIDGVESQNDDAFANAFIRRSSEPGDSARHRLIDSSSSTSRADFSLTDAQQAVHPFELDCSPGRFAPSFVLLMPFLICREAPQCYDASSAGRCQTTAKAVARTCSQEGLRTHSLTKVSDEKRNADECPPTGGKSNCHR